MDVLRRCREYGRDMARLRLALECARDAAVRITRSTSTSSGAGSGISDKPGGYAARADVIQRAMDARRAMYALELDEAVRLIAQLEPVQGAVMHKRLVQGLTIRQAAADLHTSESAVRGLYRRGRETLSLAQSPLDDAAGYQAMVRIYRGA